MVLLKFQVTLNSDNYASWYHKDDHIEALLNLNIQQEVEKLINKKLNKAYFVDKVENNSAEGRVSFSIW